MKLRTVIDWRLYPEQKPEAELMHHVISEGVLHVALWMDIDGEWKWSRPDVTHFALPFDISTVEV